MKVIPLDKIIEQGTTYTTHERVCLKIEKWGTDATSECYLTIDGKVTGSLITYVAPLHKTSSLNIGPLDLGSKYLAIPPDTDFEVTTPSGASGQRSGS